jgi:tetratricopeptide (TPR) repeat protein
VIGYSGWEGDVIMMALKRRLENFQLPYNMYWFCYQRSNIDTLPDWLKKNQQVYFVVPSLQEEAKSSALKVQQVMDKLDSKIPTLSAHQVLDKLLQVFNYCAPHLTTDPLGFFAQYLQNSLPQDNEGEIGNDIYSIKSVIERINQSNQRLNQVNDNAETTAKTANSPLEKVRDALRRSQYKELIEEARKLQTDHLTQEEMQELINALWSAATNLFDNSEEEILCYDLIITIINSLPKENIEKNLEISLAKALFNKGQTLLNKADESGENAVREEEITVYIDLINRFSDATDNTLRKSVAMALVNKGYAFQKLTKHQEAIAAYDEALDRFGKIDELALHEQIAMALVNKGSVLIDLNENDRAIAVYDEVIERFGNIEDLALHRCVAIALINKSIIFAEKNRDTKDIYEEVIRRFGEAKDTQLREQVTYALNGIGFQIFCQAKSAWQNNDESSAKKYLMEAHDKIDAAYERMPDNAFILGNKAYIRFLMGDKNEARALLSKAISIGGEEVRKAEIEDSKIHPLPQDEEFRELVNSIPGQL